MGKRTGVENPLYQVGNEETSFLFYDMAGGDFVPVLSMVKSDEQLALFYGV